MREKGKDEVDVEDGWMDAWMRGWAGGASYPIEEIGLECCARVAGQVQGASVIWCQGKKETDASNEVWCELFFHAVDVR